MITIEIETLRDLPRLIHYGVLTIQKKPLYIVEVMAEKVDIPSQYVTVYAVEPESKPPIKAYERVVKNQGFKETTTLGLLASKLYKPKNKEYKRVKPPLFMTELVYGTDTFTGKYGKGFYEREQDTVKVVNGKPQVIFGEKTGVFIGLDSIGWEKIVVAPDDILEEYLARKRLWYLY